jgi:hypothetical protein
MRRREFITLLGAAVAAWPCADFEMAQCQRCPTTVVEMANSLISHNVYREKRELKPIDAKGKGEAQILFREVRDCGLSCLVQS